SGPALVPGDPGKSLMIRALTHAEDSLAMPPKGKLPPDVIELLTNWVASGAPWPTEFTPVSQSGRLPGASTDPHWAWASPPRRVSPGSSHQEQTIDARIRSRLKAEGLSPAPPADRHTLIRRLSFDLTGLPPLPEDIESFCRTADPKALETLVDKLLASPRFGERWGRHWLDVARYSDSIGGGMNHVIDDAWRYRDYVVSSFNADKPYDRFVLEQIAGDLLPAESELQRVENLVATGFLMLGVIELGEYDREKLRMDIVDEQLDTLGKAFLGLTLGCARCHDHKFDPVPTRDYYAMAGILRSTNPLDEKKSAGLFAALQRLPLPQDAATSAVIARATTELATVKRSLTDAQAAAQKAPSESKQAATDRVEALRADVKHREAAIRAMTPMALAVGEEPRPADSPVFIRGDVHNAGPMVPRGFLSLARLETAPSVPEGQSGRLELARWMTHPENPLLSRVMANRIWHWLMGSGLVRSVDNFGTRGEAPSHPELLDDLARRLMASGWSVKALVREIVLSETYQQSAKSSPEALEADPENRLQSRHQRRRLDAEEIHDALLLVSGILDETIGGPTNTRTGRLGSEGKDERVARDPSRRRGLYQPIYRGGLAPDLFRVFDFPDAGLVTGSRNVTTVAPQALFLMNSPVMLRHARDCARRHAAETADEVERVHRLCLRLFGRPPTDREAAAAHTFLTGTSETGETAWAALCQSFMISNHFLFVD
ncbi:MAG: DUF1553 domain-containing protein, partial [Verrucomicrobia bacterium]|nr:DUF1553 domain-containing protein [Verrucomicrobiota bacterium]